MGKGPEEEAAGSAGCGVWEARTGRWGRRLWSTEGLGAERGPFLKGGDPSAPLLRLPDLTPAGLQGCAEVQGDQEAVRQSSGGHGAVAGEECPGPEAPAPRGGGGYGCPDPRPKVFPPPGTGLCAPGESLGLGCHCRHGPDVWSGPSDLRKLQMLGEGSGVGNAPGKGPEVGTCLGQARAGGCRRVWSRE